MIDLVLNLTSSCPLTKRDLSTIFPHVNGPNIFKLELTQENIFVFIEFFLQMDDIFLFHALWRMNLSAPVQWRENKILKSPDFGCGTEYFNMDLIEDTSYV